MDAHIHSIDNLKDGEIQPKSSGRTFRVDGAKPNFTCHGDWVIITGQSLESYTNNADMFNRIAPDREIVRTATISLSKEEILSLLSFACDNSLISHRDISQLTKKQKA